MPIPAAEQICFEIVMRGQAAAGGSDSKNINLVFRFRRTALVIAPVKTVIETAFDAAIATPVLAALNVRYTQSITDIRCLDDAQDPYTSVVRLGVGAIAGDSLSTFQSAYLLHRSAIRGKSFRGSKHIGPMSESDVGFDVWNAGCLGRLAAINTALLAGFTDAAGNVWKYVIVAGFFSQMKVNPTTVLHVDVTQGLVNERIGSMLQRKVKSTY